MSPPSPARSAAEHLIQRRGPDDEGSSLQASPACVLLAGPPLAGKTTLARAIVDVLEPAVHVENDALRPIVADVMGHERPRFGADETQATYEAARRVVQRALEAGYHAVHDATNLDEATRAPVQETARALDAATLVVLVQAPEPVRRSRAHEAGAAARRAHEALGKAAPDPEALEDALTVDGTRPPGLHVETVLDRLDARVREPAARRDAP